MFRTMAGGVNLGQDRLEKNWAQCLAADIRVLKATEGFGVETVLWPRSAKNGRNWHRGIVDAADRFMTRRHRGEAEENLQRLTAVGAGSSNKEKTTGTRTGAAVLIHSFTSMQKRTVDRVARYY